MVSDEIIGKITEFMNRKNPSYIRRKLGTAE